MSERKTGSAAFPRRVPRRRRTAVESADAVRPAPAPRAVGGLLAAAAGLCAAAVFLPLWGMTLVSTQYPEGLRMVVYPTRITGDLREINVLNHYIGMREITDSLFVELKLLPVLLGAIAAACLVGAAVRRVWATLLPLGMMGATAAYGFWTMTRRLHQFGRELDPAAAIEIEPFTPPMLGEHTLAQFATWSYFSWGTFLPALAGLLAAAALFLQLRARRGTRESARALSLVPAAAAAALGAALLVAGG